MRFPIRIALPWQPMFGLFGFFRETSYVAVEGSTLVISFGTARESIPIEQVAKVRPRYWPFVLGLGPKLDPTGGVAYIGSTEGVVEIELVGPRALNVWGPFRHDRARHISVSLEDPEGFMGAVREAKER